MQLLRQRQTGVNIVLQSSDPNREPVSQDRPGMVWTVVLIYAAVASLWIMLSDRVLEW